jgi:multiple sugar transport system permease protein
MASAVLAVIPMVVIYLIFQKQFIEGIATSGGKLRLICV